MDDDSDTEYTVHTKKQTLKKPTTKRKRIEKDQDEDDDDYYCEYTTGNDAPSKKEKNNKKDEMSNETLSELTVAKLRDILKSYNLSTSGSKNLLISRIMEHQENSKKE